MQYDGVVSFQHSFEGLSTAIFVMSNLKLNGEISTMSNVFYA